MFVNIYASHFINNRTGITLIPALMSTLTDVKYVTQQVITFWICASIPFANHFFLGVMKIGKTFLVKSAMLWMENTKKIKQQHVVQATVNNILQAIRLELNKTRFVTSSQCRRITRNHTGWVRYTLVVRYLLIYASNHQNSSISLFRHDLKWSWIRYWIQMHTIHTVNTPFERTLHLHTFNWDNKSSHNLTRYFFGLVRKWWINRTWLSVHENYIWTIKCVVWCNRTRTNRQLLIRSPIFGHSIVVVLVSLWTPEVSLQERGSKWISSNRLQM